MASRQQKPTLASNFVSGGTLSLNSDISEEKEDNNTANLRKESNEDQLNNLLQLKASDIFKRFGAKKKNGLRAKEKRMRQNKKLRKVLLPKSAWNSLREVNGIKITDVVIYQKSTDLFQAIVSVNNMQYEGIGTSKSLAKNNACEKALRDIVINKMMALQQKQNENNAVKKEEKPDVVMENSSDNGQDQELDSIEDEDMPIVNLASFAIYKLFSEWQREGFHIPEFFTKSNNVEPKEDNSNVQIKKKELPGNWQSLHPTSLLCLMIPGIHFTELPFEGTGQDIIQKMSVIIDGEEFIGSARSKKLAKLHAAILALNKIYNLNINREDF